MKILGQNPENIDKQRCAATHIYEQNGGIIILGEGSYINALSFLRADHYNIEIGKNCSISELVNILTYYGSYFCEGYREKKNGPVIIKDNVWIGHGAHIRGNVTIGEWAIVGMGAVVTKNIEPFHVVVGNPGVDKGLRADAEQIKKYGYR